MGNWNGPLVYLFLFSFTVVSSEVRTGRIMKLTNLTDFGAVGEGPLHSACKGDDKLLSDDPMLFAAAKGDATALSEFIAAGYEVDHMDSEGVTALYTAIEHCRWSTADFLLGKGAEVDAGKGTSGSLLFKATTWCDHFTAGVLLQAGADINSIGPNGLRPLQWAAQKDCLGVVKVLVARGADVNDNWTGTTPLLQAAAHANIPLIDFLIRSGAEVNPKSDSTPLLSACRAGRLASVVHLLKRGAQLNKTDSVYNRTPLHWMAVETDLRYVNVAEKLLELGAYAESRDKTYATPLHLAALNNNNQMMKVLIRNKADVNAKDNRMSTPLHKVSFGQGDSGTSATLLIESGADVNAADYQGRTPLHIAASQDNTNVLRVLVKKMDFLDSRSKYDKDIFRYTHHTEDALKEYRQLIKLLMKGKINWETTRSGYTALELAVLYGFVDTVDILLKAGADVDPIGSNWPPLHLACFLPNFKITEMLIASGADINSKDETGWTPLHKAVWTGHEDIVDLLLRNNASIRAIDGFGWTPLHVASKYTSNTAVNQLIAAGCEIDAKDLGGFSPLIWAEIGRKNRILELLVDKGVDLIPNNRYLKSHREMRCTLCDGHHGDIVRKLLQSGADIDTRDRILGWSALHWAAAAGDIDMVKFLFDKGALMNLKSNLGTTPMGLSRYWGSNKVYNFMKSLGSVW